VREVALAMLASLIGGSIAAPFVFKLLVKLKSAQNVSAHLEGHQHKQGTPTMGGIIVLVGLLCGMAATWRAEYLGVLVLILGFAAVGFADDYLVPKMNPGSRGLHWMPKLGLEIGAAVGAAVMSGWSGPVQMGLFVFLVLFLSNAYNFSDGLDTLSGGLGVILCIGFAALYVLVPELVGIQTNPGHAGIASNQLVLALSLGVAFLPFLFYNAPPAKIFMGDVGALPIGAVLAWFVAGILLPQDDQSLISSQFVGPVTVILLVMFAEIIPPPLQVFWVKVFKKRAFNFKTPIHHAFEDLGWPHTRIVWAFHVVQAALVVLALAWMWL
jgi:phospho-N-acetylmuramoyl-pentapeptide-transferase